MKEIRRKNEKKKGMKEEKVSKCLIDDVSAISLHTIRFRRKSLRGFEIRQSIEKLAAKGYVKPVEGSSSPKEMKSQKVEM